MKRRITGCSSKCKRNNQPLNFFAPDDFSKKLYTYIELKDGTDNLYKSFFYVMNPVSGGLSEKGRPSFFNIEKTNKSSGISGTRFIFHFLIVKKDEVLAE